MSKHNENRAGYKKTKIGWIPEEWSLLHLKECTDVILSNVDKKSHLDEIEVRLCNYTDVYYNEEIDNSINFMRATATHSEIDRFSIKQGDVLITKDSESADDIAVPAYVSINVDKVLCGYHLTLLRPKKSILNGRFLTKLLQIQIFRHYFFTLANGVTRFGLTSESTGNANIPLPPLPEQEKIAQILSAWDRAIEATRKLIAAKEKQKKALMQKLLTGRMRFPQFGPPAKNGELPEGWKRLKLGQVCDVLDNRRIPLNSSQRSNMKGNIPYWGANGIVDYIDDYIFDEPLIILAEDGGHFAEAYSRPICNLIDGKSWVNNHAHVLRTKHNVIREWVYYWFVHRNIVPFLNGGTRTKLNQSDLIKLPIWLPTKSEQYVIAKMISELDYELNKLEQILIHFGNQKKGLMQKLLTGEIRVKI